MSELQIEATGKLIAAKTAQFKDDDGNDVLYGRVQLMSKDDNGFYSVRNLKVRRDNFGVLPSLEKFMNKEITCAVDQTIYQGRQSLYFNSVVPKA